MQGRFEEQGIVGHFLEFVCGRGFCSGIGFLFAVVVEHVVDPDYLQGEGAKYGMNDVESLPARRFPNDCWARWAPGHGSTRRFNSPLAATNLTGSTSSESIRARTRVA